MNRDPRAHIRHGALPSIAPSLLRYFQASTQARKVATGKVMAPLLFAAAAEHRKLAQDAGAAGLLRAGGWIKAYRSARGRDLAHGEAEELKLSASSRRSSIAPRSRRSSPCRGEGDRRRSITPSRCRRRSGGAHRSYAALMVKRGAAWSGATC